MLRSVFRRLRSGVRVVVARVVAARDWLLLGSSVAIIVLVVGYLKQDVSLRAANRSIAASARAVAREESRLAQFGVAAVQQNVNARFDDCSQLNALRAGLRGQVSQSQATVPLLFELVPSLNTPVVRQLVQASYAREMRAYAPVDCRAYARRAVPRGDTHRYRIP